jgi:GMP synthase (glutamine-hydrolysing)
MQQPSRSRLLLLQIRNEPRVRQEEFDSFLQFSGLKPTQIDVLNVFDKPYFGHEVLHGYDALLVGGASEASVLEPQNYPFVGDCIRLLAHCIDIGLPVFASCFGFQLAVLALGGKIVRDEKDFEMGTIPISLTAAAREDALFRDIPDGFLAVSVHRERAPALPESCELLGYTGLCPHAFKVKNKPFWAFQFHPEVNKKILVERLTIYKSHYTAGDSHLEEVLESASETPHANDLPGKFIAYLEGHKPELST